MGERPIQDDIRRARRGDREALDRVLARTQPRLLRLAEVRLGPRLRKKVRPSDVLQSAYLEVVRKMPEFSGDSEDQFLAWMSVVIEHAIRDRVRYFDAAKRSVGGDPATRLEENRVRDPGQRDPGAVVALWEDLGLVERALARMDESHRLILTLVVKEGRSHREAAEVLGKTEGATRVLLTRARAALLVEMDRLRDRKD